MANKVLYPSANVLQMFMPDLVRDERYNSKDFIDFEFPETILPWEQITTYCQPWQLNDTIQLQLQTNVGPVNFIIKDCETDKVLDTIAFTQKQQSDNEPGLFIYEIAVPLSGYPEGCYYVELDFGGAVFTLRSGELNFSVLHEDTLLLEFKHYEFREDLVFETGLFPSVRIHGTNRFDRPKNKSSVYEDQVLNMTALRSQKYRAWNLVLGGSYGLPDYFADMIAGIIGCSDFRVDGKNFTVDKDAGLEPNGIDYYPMRGWSVELRERYTRGSRTYENNEPIDGNIIVMANVDLRGFNKTGQQQIILDVE